MEEYKYLGIILSTRENYLDAQENSWRTKFKRALEQIHSKALWGFNRFEITRLLWKATAVLKVTYCNSVVTVSPQTRKCFEMAQRDAGRIALGIPYIKVANAFIDGELGWSTFKPERHRAKFGTLNELDSCPQIDRRKSC